MYSFIYTMMDYAEQNRNSQDDIKKLVRHYTDFVKNSIKEESLDNKIMNQVAGKNTSKKIQSS